MTGKDIMKRKGQEGANLSLSLTESAKVYIDPLGRNNAAYWGARYILNS